MGFFEKLYGEVPQALGDLPNISFPRLSTPKITFLEELITNDEIKKALFDIAPLKAPENDGYHAHFFQSQWDILVSWDFISASLMAVEVPEFLRKVIISAISSSSMQILWNGVLTQKFKLARGIHQGCPLPLYFFVLCMDWLGHLIRADINIGISNDDRNQIVQMFGFQEVQNLGTYLVVPLFHNRLGLLEMAKVFVVGRTLESQRHLTNSERIMRGIGQSNSCTMCRLEFEDMAHVLRDCPAVKDVGMHVLSNHLK
ncbi:hypothetical protein J1N35_027224 [Gossypium stocksii]|uniref:Reverse transcriptase domain-containing protein n=1 Tax=Gossypium stocksii TaxID=47602 RepID=A0A9D3ZZD7_9ROSI|nr:hypothetical protein J1N35_027224 [Gossypium stocksii]